MDPPLLIIELLRNCFLYQVIQYPGFLPHPQNKNNFNFEAGFREFPFVAFPSLEKIRKKWIRLESEQLISFWELKVWTVVSCID